jgi:hypothetical protein
LTIRNFAGQLAFSLISDDRERQLFGSAHDKVSAPNAVAKYKLHRSKHLKEQESKRIINSANFADAVARAAEAEKQLLELLDKEEKEAITKKIASKSSSSKKKANKHKK